MDNVICENCKFAKFRRHLNSNQSLRMSLANVLYEKHEASLQKKYETLEEIVSEFCKLGHINRKNDCKYFQPKWWKFWIKK